MGTNRGVSILLLTLGFVADPLLVPLFASPVPSIKRSKSDRDINAIGHRDIMREPTRKFIGSPEKERERGAAWAAEIERSTKVIHDSTLTGYLAALAQNIARNSNPQFPIPAPLLDTIQVHSSPSPPRYQSV